jgi:DNA-binding response OmpR family regulator
VLVDTLKLIAVFILGSASGVLLTYIKQKHGLAGLRDLLKIAPPFPRNLCDSSTRFAMKALVITHDPEMISMLSLAFREKRISTKTCFSDAAVEQLSSDKFTAVVLDLDRVRGCSQVLEHLPGANKRLLVIAVASDSVNKAMASRLGASFVIERPLHVERLRTLLASAYGRMLHENQVYFRLAIEMPVSVRRASGDLLQCTTLNVSQTGLAVSTPVLLTVGEAIHLAFGIPNTEICVSAEGRVIWDDKHGKSGITFECTSSSVHASFCEWLHDHFHRNLETTAPSDTTNQVFYAD